MLKLRHIELTYTNKIRGIKMRSTRTCRALSFEEPVTDDSNSNDSHDLWFSDSTAPIFSKTSNSLVSTGKGTIITDDQMDLEITTGVELSVSTLRNSPKLIVNCERENIFAELRIFAEESISVLGSICPRNSPVKSKSFALRPLQEHDEDLSESLSILTRSSVATFWNNNMLALTIHDKNGRNFALLTNKVALLKRQLKKADPETFQLFIEKYRSDLTTTLLEKLRNNLNVTQFLIFLKLAAKYPKFSAELIYLTLTTNKNMDIYLRYKTYDNYLYKRASTADSVEPDLGFKEYSEKFLAPGKF